MDMFQIQQHGSKFWSFSWHSPSMDKHVFQQTVEKGWEFPNHVARADVHNHLLPKRSRDYVSKIGLRWLGKEELLYFSVSF